MGISNIIENTSVTNIIPIVGRQYIRSIKLISLYITRLKNDTTCYLWIRTMWWLGCICCFYSMSFSYLTVSMLYRYLSRFSSLSMHKSHISKKEYSEHKSEWDDFTDKLIHSAIITEFYKNTNYLYFSHHRISGIILQCSRIGSLLLEDDEGSIPGDDIIVLSFIGIFFMSLLIEPIFIIEFGNTIIRTIITIIALFSSRVTFVIGSFQ